MVNAAGGSALAGRRRQNAHCSKHASAMSGTILPSLIPRRNHRPASPAPLGELVDQGDSLAAGSICVYCRVEPPLDGFADREYARKT